MTSGNIWVDFVTPGVNKGTALQTLIDNGMEANELTDEAKQQFVDVSKSCYDKFKELIQDDDLFSATAKFTGRE